MQQGWITMEKFDEKFLWQCSCMYLMRYAHLDAAMWTSETQITEDKKNLHAHISTKISEALILHIQYECH